MQPFDRNVLGLCPDLIVEIRWDFLEEVDGPMPAHGSQDFHGQDLLHTPRRVVDMPGVEYLEQRWNEFPVAKLTAINVRLWPPVTVPRGSGEGNTWARTGCCGCKLQSSGSFGPKSIETRRHNVREVEHHIQDACEIFAVATLQRLAWEDSRGSRTSFDATIEEFNDYLASRNLSESEIRGGSYSEYIISVERHVPAFYDRFTRLHPSGDLAFDVIEVEARNAKRKADFAITVAEERATYEVSLKNYRSSARRPQVCSGTFNSFILNMLFASPSVGAFTDVNGETFRGSDRTKRDFAVQNVAGAGTVLELKALDELNASMRELFLGPEFEFLHPERFKTVAQQVGRRGRDICLSLLWSFPGERVRQRVLTMAGLDGAEDALFFDPDVSTDSITNERFRHLLETVQDPSTTLAYEKEGAQSIRFAFRDHEGVEVLTISVPFTINKNGAWISDSKYLNGPRYHAKEGQELAYGQRRPRKSREIATSVNTYVEFGKAGIFE